VPVKFVALLALVVTLATTAIAEAQRRIPDDNLAYPVLVNHSAGTASGFMLNTDTATYFVTARHVLYDAQGQLRSPVTLSAFGDDPKDKGKFVFDIDLAALNGGGHVRDDPKQGVVVVRFSTNTAGQAVADVLPGVTIRSRGTSWLIGVGLANVKRFDEVLVSNAVMIFGYPRSLGVPVRPQFDPDRPLLPGG
jgi:hypothetical protein